MVRVEEGHASGRRSLQRGCSLPFGSSKEWEKINIRRGKWFFWGSSYWFGEMYAQGFNNPMGLSIKVGSLQKFVKNYGSCEDMGPGAFPVEEVHKISVLDMRLANAGNILMAKEAESGRIILIPIDHGYCLPESFEDCTFDWLYCPQAQQPYTPDTIDYIRSLDAEEDNALLKFYGWDLSLECARVLRISTMLLKKGVEKGLTPFAIGNLVCRETLKKESVVEEIVQEALDSVLPGSSESAVLELVSIIMDRRLHALAM